MVFQILGVVEVKEVMIHHENVLASSIPAPLGKRKRNVPSSFHSPKLGGTRGQSSRDLLETTATALVLFLPVPFPALPTPPRVLLPRLAFKMSESRLRRGSNIQKTLALRHMIFF